MLHITSLETANLNSSDIPLHVFKMVKIWKQRTNILTIPNVGEEVEPRKLSPTLGGAQHGAASLEASLAVS